MEDAMYILKWFNERFLFLIISFVAGTCLGVSPEVLPITDHVDLIEVNHFHDENGKLVFDQVVYYEWLENQSRHQVIDWRVLKKEEMRPSKNFETGMYEAVWFDDQTFRKVVSVAARESWTGYDPELKDRSFLPKEKRRLLSKVPRRRNKVKENPTSPMQSSTGPPGEEVFFH